MTSRTKANTDGCAGQNSPATFSLVRSTASVYWMRSFVPIEKKFTSRAKWLAIRAAAGTSIMMPIGISRRNAMPSSSSSSITSLRTIFAWRSSINVLIIGNMIHISKHAGPHDRAELALEHGDIVQTHADAAVAEERVALGIGAAGLGLL